MILLILILLLVFGFGGYRVGGNYAPGYGFPFGLGTVLVVCLIIWLLGGFSGLHGPVLVR